MTTSQLVFDPFSANFFNGPYETYRRMREEAPVYYSTEYDFYALTRHADVAAVFRDHETYSSAYGVDLAMVRTGEKPPATMIISLDPPEHRHMRSLVSKAFTPRAITRLRDMVDEKIEHFLHAVDPGEFDVVSDFSAFFPVEVITTMLGVPPEYRQQVRLWIDEQLHREPGQIEVSEADMEAMAQAWLMYYDLIKQRRAEPRDDMISALVAAEVEREDGGVSTLRNSEIAGFTTLLVGAGAETVTKLIGNAAAVFARLECSIALDKLLDFMPEYEVLWDRCERVSMQNVAGWSHVLVRVYR